MNSSTRFKGCLLLGAGLILIISVFLPFIKFDSTMMGEAISKTYSLMPSAVGFIILVLGGFAAFMPLAGIKNKSGIYGILIGIVSGGLLFYQYNKMKDAEVYIGSINDIFSEAFGASAGDFSFTVSFGIGFFVAVVGIIAVVGTSLIYNMSDDY